MGSGTWETPLGNVQINEEVSLMLEAKTPLLQEDSIPHLREHSLELQVPFLTYRNPDVQLVPIIFQHLTYQECEEIGKAIAQTVAESKAEILLLASNDMSHFESQEVAEKKDKLAIDRILALDPHGLYMTVHKEHITMCGVIPTTVMLAACVSLGAKEAELVTYATSGRVSGDYSSVVGYAGIMIH